MPNKSSDKDQLKDKNNSPEQSENIQDSNKEFPGYPHYSAKDDIMNNKDAERIEVDIDNLSRSNLTSAAAMQDQTANASSAKPISDTDDDLKIVPGTEADVNKDDLIALAGSDEELRNRKTVTGEDLDVPGSEDDDANEDIGEEDEENNYYSIGGDSHENLEEDKDLG